MENCGSKHWQELSTMYTISQHITSGGKCFFVFCSYGFLLFLNIGNFVFNNSIANGVCKDAETLQLAGVFSQTLSSFCCL